MISVLADPIGVLGITGSLLLSLGLLIGFEVSHSLTNIILGIGKSLTVIITHLCIGCHLSLMVGNGLTEIVQDLYIIVVYISNIL